MADTAPAVAAIRARTARKPIVAIILGSGLGALADAVRDATRIAYADIPGWERSTAPGHAGELVVGELAGKDVAIMRGRLHYRGPNDERLGPRFPDMVGTYTDELRSIARSVDPDVREGVYVAVPGPNFETPAELRMLRGLGADAVGMSTVPEVIAARHLGMRILAIATVTDMATGIPGQIEHVTAEQVLEVANRTGARLGALVTGVVAKL